MLAISYFLQVDAKSCRQYSSCYVIAGKKFTQRVWPNDILNGEVNFLNAEFTHLTKNVLKHGVPIA